MQAWSGTALLLGLAFAHTDVAIDCNLPLAPPAAPAAAAPAMDLALFTGAITVETTAASPVTVQLSDAAGHLRANRHAVADEQGVARFRLQDGGLDDLPTALLLPGDIVTVTLADGSRFDVALPLLLAAPDVAKAALVGLAPPNELVELTAFDPAGKIVVAGLVRAARGGDFRLATGPSGSGALKPGAWGLAALRRSLSPTPPTGARRSTLSSCLMTSRAALVLPGGPADRCRRFDALPVPARSRSLRAPRFGHRAATVDPGTARITARLQPLTARVTLWASVLGGRASSGIGMEATSLGSGGAWFAKRLAAGPADGEGAYALAFERSGDRHTVMVGDAISITPTLGSGIGGLVPRLAIRPVPDSQRLQGAAPPGSTVAITVRPDLFDDSPGPTVALTATADASGRFDLPWEGPERLTTRSMVSVELAAGPMTFVGRGRASSLEVSLYGELLTGTAPPGSPVHLTVAAAGGARDAYDVQAGDDGRFRITTSAESGRDKRFKPGDTLLVGFDEAPVEQLVLPAMDVVVDVESDLVSGAAPPGAIIEVQVVGQPGILAAEVADDAGHFAASLAGRVDLKAGAAGLVRARLGDRDKAIVLGWAVPGATLTLGSAVVRGLGPPGQTAQASVTRCGLAAGGGAGPVQVETLPDGNVSVGWRLDLRAADGTPRSIAAGDRVALDLGRDQIELGVPDVTVSSNPDADFVTGIAPPDRPMDFEVSRGGNRLLKQSAVRSDGRYLFNLAGGWDLAPGDQITLTLELAPGYLLSVPSTVNRLEVKPETGALQGYAPAGALVTAELRDAAKTLVASGRARANGFGGFDLLLSSDSGAIVVMREGEELKVHTSSGDIALQLPPFTVQLDETLGRVFGRAAPGGALAINVAPAACDPSGPLGLIARAGTADGSFSETLPPGRLRAGAAVTVRQRSGDGDVIALTRRLPQFQVQVGGNLVSGSVAPRSQVRAELRRSGSRLAAAARLAGLDGAFELRLPILAPDAAQPDDELELAWQEGDGEELPTTGIVTLPLPRLRAYIAPATHMVSGTAPAGAEVWLWPYGPGIRQNSVVIHVSADLAGRFGASFPAARPAEPLPAGSAVEASVYDGAGNRLYARAVTPFLEMVIGGRVVAGSVDPLRHVGLEQWRAGRLVSLAEASSDTLGQFDAVFEPLSAEPGTVLAVGDQLRLAQPAYQSVRLTVPSLTVELDRAERQLGGAAPPGALFELLAYARGRDAVSLAVAANAAGRWQVDDGALRARGLSFDTLMTVEARLTVDNGHLVMARSASAATPTLPPTSTPKLPSPTPRATTPATTTPEGAGTPGATPITPLGPIYLPRIVLNAVRSTRSGSP